jgi:1-deoxyxylulose-5-phosphate synthase
VSRRCRPFPRSHGLREPWAHILASIDASLKRLALDYVDLYQIHRWDPLKRSRLRRRGCFDAEPLQLVYRDEERQMIPQCLDQGVAVLPWNPLARGLLAGNRTREGERLTTRAQTDEFVESLYKPEIDFAVVDRAAEVAAARGVTSAQIALASLLHKPGVTAPIVGATKVEHLEDAIAAERLSLST